MTVTLSDAQGEQVTKNLQVTVLNPELVVTAGPPQTVEVGALVSLTAATFSDPSAPLASGGYAATVNWGDGTTTDVNPLVSPPGTPADSGRVYDSHYYGQPGTYTVLGTRDGYRPVQLEFTVEPGQQSVTITVTCSEHY